MKTHAGRKLSRPTGARLSLLKNQAAALLLHEHLETTVAKGREVSRLAEQLVTLGKAKTLVARRRVAALVANRALEKKIFEVLAPRYAARAGGCTRLFRLGPRRGDGAQMALLKLIQ